MGTRLGGGMVVVAWLFASLLEYKKLIAEGKLKERRIVIYAIGQQKYSAGGRNGFNGV